MASARECLTPAQVRTGLGLLVGLLGAIGLLLLTHRSVYPYVWRYSRLYVLGLATYALVLLAVVALAWFGARPVARLLRFRVVRAGALLILGFGLILLVLEGVLALLPARLWDPDPQARDGAIFARQEPPLHHVRPANSREMIVSPHGEFRVEVRINSDSLRDVERPVAKPPGTLRILVLGDSMVEAVQVELEATFPKRLERSLAAALARPVDVINAGVASSSPTTEYLMLKYKGLKYSPDVVVMAFFPADVQDDWIYRKDLVFDERGVPLVRASRDENLRASLGPALLAHWRGLRFVLGHALGFTRSAFTDLAVSIFDAHEDAREREAWALTTTAIRATRDLAVTHGARFALMAVPYPVQVAGDGRMVGRAGPEVTRLLTASARPQQVLARFSREQEIPYLDLLPALRGSSAHPLFFARDQHLTPLGHAVTARAVAAFLRERGLVR